MPANSPYLPFEPEPHVLGNNSASRRRYYQIAGITVQVESAIPITEKTFAPKFQQFEVTGPGDDTVRIRHYFSLPNLTREDLGLEVYRKHPWAIFRKDQSWVYLCISPAAKDSAHHQVAVLNDDYTDARIYNDAPFEQLFRQGGMTSLTLFPTDQVLLARVLAGRQACYIHSGAVILNGKGLVFLGHSEAGKSTMVKMLQKKAKVLCDDRNIIRQHPDQFKVHGTWSHGEVPLVSGESAPLRAIFFLHKANRTGLLSQIDQSIIIGNLLACLIRPFVTADWWNHVLNLVQAIAQDVPCFDLEFDQSGDVVQVLEDLNTGK